eukprot:638769-Prorocentrum_minimum.AAC.2
MGVCVCRSIARKELDGLVASTDIARGLVNAFVGRSGGTDVVDEPLWQSLSGRLADCLTGWGYGSHLYRGRRHR